MDAIKDLNGIDWVYVFCAIIAALVALKFLWTLIEWFIDKLGLETKKVREKRENRELLIATTELAKTTAENLNKLQNKHNQDEKEFRDNLNAYIEESREDRKALHEEMSKYRENRINDRKQSLEIQKELKDSITSRDEKIGSLIIANKEMLAEKINEKYKYYISIEGIPEDEYDEFISLHGAYKAVGGNHHGDSKFKYCMEHLPVLPVKTKLVKE